MKARIRATDVEQFINLIESYPSWQWEEWDVLAEIHTPTLFLTGELERTETTLAGIPRP